MKLDKLSIAILVITAFCVGYGVYIISAEPEYENVGYSLAIFAAGIAGITLYKLATKRRGQ